MFKRILLQIELILIALSLVCFASVTAETSYKIKSTDNLSKIINTYYKDSNLNKSQIMIGILAENPNSFRYGNVNALKDKQILSLPAFDHLMIMSEKQASSLIKEHHKHFRQKIKKSLKPPFDTNASGDQSVTALAKVQQDKINELKKLEAERAELLARVEKLIEDKKDMDTQLQQLINETKE